MAGLVPAIHVLLSLPTGKSKTWMPGIKPGMTAERLAHSAPRTPRAFHALKDRASLREVAMTNMDPKKDDGRRYAEMAMSWYGWGSPVGIGVLLLCISASIYLLHASGLF
jgi:hypothetical protein